MTDDGHVATENRNPGVSTPVMRTLLGHTAHMQGLAIAPDARTLATASFDGTVRVWDLVAGGGAIPVLQCPGVAAVALGRSRSADYDDERGPNRDVGHIVGEGR